MWLVSWSNRLKLSFSEANKYIREKTSTLRFCPFDILVHAASYETVHFFFLKMQ